MSLDQIIPAALQLPAKERPQLAASLWESIADPYSLDGSRSDEDAVSLALARHEELENGTVSPLSHADLMQQLRA